jgi:hypothetical protein
MGGVLIFESMLNSLIDAIFYGVVYCAWNCSNIYRITMVFFQRNIYRKRAITLYTEINEIACSKVICGNTFWLNFKPLFRWRPLEVKFTVFTIG